MNNKELFEKFKRVVDSNIKKGRFFTLKLTAVEIAALHGCVVLTAKHSKVQKQSLAFLDTLSTLRGYLLDKFKEMGFTQMEVQKLDERELT